MYKTHDTANYSELSFLVQVFGSVGSDPWLVEQNNCQRRFGLLVVEKGQPLETFSPVLHDIELQSN